MNHTDHNKVVCCLKESMFSTFRTMRDGETETHTWHCSAKQFGIFIAGFHARSLTASLTGH